MLEKMKRIITDIDTNKVTDWRSKMKSVLFDNALCE